MLALFARSHHSRTTHNQGTGNHCHVHHRCNKCIKLLFEPACV